MIRRLGVLPKPPADAVPSAPVRGATEEQISILAAASSTKSNLILNAYAGCGKTSTLEMLDSKSKTRPCLYLVFNTKNAKEATERMQSTTTVRTFNSLGARIWAAVYGQHGVEKQKTQGILREMIKEVPKGTAQQEMWNSFQSVVAGVAMAKALGYIPAAHPQAHRSLIGASSFHARLEEIPDDLTCDLIDAVLLRSIAQSYKGRVDFNDQIYMPALFGGTFPKFPLTLADEAQDLNPVNHLLLSKLVGDRRLIAVGDPHQSIYGFRGAVESGMSQLASAFSMDSLSLSVSFRCPQAIVEAARWRVPEFQWIKRGGHVETLTQLHLSDINPEAAIICRNNAPLFGLALRLLAAGHSISLAGSDIGPRLIGIMERLGGRDDLSRPAFLAAIAEWEAEKLAAESTTAHDLAACMRVFAQQTTSRDQAITYVKHVFAQSGSIQLMTGHKAKGLEFPIVYHLDPWLVRNGRLGAPPSEQDQNLDYVITTRSQDQLYEIDTRNIIE